MNCRHPLTWREKRGKKKKDIFLPFTLCLPHKKKDNESFLKRCFKGHKHGCWKSLISTGKKYTFPLSLTDKLICVFERLLYYLNTLEGIQGELKVCAQVALCNLCCLAWVFISGKKPFYSYLVEEKMSLLRLPLHSKSKSVLPCLLSLLHL